MESIAERRNLNALKWAGIPGASLCGRIGSHEDKGFFFLFRCGLGFFKFAEAKLGRGEHREGSEFVASFCLLS